MGEGTDKENVVLEKLSCKGDSGEDGRSLLGYRQLLSVQKRHKLRAQQGEQRGGPQGHITERWQVQSWCVQPNRKSQLMILQMILKLCILLLLLLLLLYLPECVCYGGNTSLSVASWSSPQFLPLSVPLASMHSGTPHPHLAVMPSIKPAQHPAKTQAVCSSPKFYFLVSIYHFIGTEIISKMSFSH